MSHELFDSGAESFNASGAETAAIKLVRAGYRELTTQNQHLMRSFDPHGDMPAQELSIDLSESFPEAAAAEPVINRLHQTQMLQALGVSLTYRDDDPSIIKWQEYDDDSGRFLRRINRGDGVMVPTIALYVKQSDRPIVTDLWLLNETRAEEERATMQELSDVALHAEALGIPFQEARQSGLTSGDLASFVQAGKDINERPTYKPDTPLPERTELDEPRYAAAESMMPIYLPSLRTIGRFVIQTAYAKEVHGFAQTHNLDEEDIARLTAAEQTERHAILNQLLAARKRVVRIGARALYGATTVIGSGAGAALTAGANTLALGNEHNPTATAIGGLLGLVIGGLLGSSAHRETMHRISLVKPFEESTDKAAFNTIRQLAAEDATAANYRQLLRWLP